MDAQPPGAVPRWSWPDDMSSSSTATDTGTGGTASFNRARATTPTPEPTPEPPRPRRNYRPRTCRICLEVVEPTIEEDTGVAGAFLRREPRVKYVSSDPADGRLICPCKCKGSQKYVHEGCLQAWRQSRPLSERNYWKCPTCGFQYKLQRMNWGRWVSSWVTRGALTVVVFALAVFVLGFVGDPIINLWLDPIGTISETATFGDFEPYEEYYDGGDGGGWFDHFLKGFFSLGLLGFVKSLFAMSPFYWFNMRLGGGRRRGGRDRMENINWAFIIIGAFTFLGAVWKFINYLSARFLEKASEKIVDVQGDDDEEEDDPQPAPRPTRPEAADESRKDI